MLVLFVISYFGVMVCDRCVVLCLVFIIVFMLLCVVCRFSGFSFRLVNFGIGLGMLLIECISCGMILCLVVMCVVIIVSCSGEVSI